VWKINKHYVASSRKGTSYIIKGRPTGLVTSCVGNAVWNTVMDKGWKWREGEEENKDQLDYINL
jgi:hypothetical protein